MTDNELNGLWVESGETLGTTMGKLRRKLDDARLLGNEADADVAETLYDKASAIQRKRNQLILSQIVQSDEIQDLTAALEAANKELNAQTKSLDDFKDRVCQITNALGHIDAALSLLPDHL